MCAQTCVDVWYTTLGRCEAVTYANHPTAGVKNCAIHNKRAAVRLQLHITLVATEINRLSFFYHKRLVGHHNPLITAMATPPTIVRNLKRQWPTDLFHTAAGDEPCDLYHPGKGSEGVPLSDDFSVHVRHF